MNPDLAMFGHIVPCGIADRGVTSLAAEGIDVSYGEVVDAFVARATAAFGAGGVDRHDVVQGPADLLGTSAKGERPLLRRLRQAGVAPEEGLDIGQRKPDWVRVPVRIGKGYRQLGSTVHDLGLVTVCEEAGCPNIYECWADGTATFMINGERCTRACGFCQVDTRHPLPLSPDEPERVAEAVERMRLGHAVITCVARDDLPDGGAGAMAETIRAIRSRTPETTVEVLISDCRGDAASLDTIFEARPDVLNHNIETVARLQRAVRPSAGYARSLAVLARAGQAGLVTKSGLMVGLGEREDEVVATMADLRGVGVSIVTIGQYLRPSRDHLPVSRYWAPEEFDRLREAGTALGVAHVEASPLTRSSYHAREAAVGGQPGSLRRRSYWEGSLPPTCDPSIGTSPGRRREVPPTHRAAISRRYARRQRNPRPGGPGLENTTGDSGGQLMANVAQSPEAVVDQAVAQPVLTPLTASAVILVLTIDDGGEPMVHDLLADLSGLARTVSFRSLEGGLAVVAGVGSDAWDRLFAGPRPAELHPFQALDGDPHRAVATPGDLCSTSARRRWASAGSSPRSSSAGWRAPPRWSTRSMDSGTSTSGTCSGSSTGPRIRPGRQPMPR